MVASHGGAVTSPPVSFRKAVQTWRGLVFVGWSIVDLVLYAGSVVFMLQAFFDKTLMSWAYGFTAALVVSWVARMVLGITLELRRNYTEERERVAVIAEKLRLTDDQRTLLKQELRRLG